MAGEDAIRAPGARRNIEKFLCYRQNIERRGGMHTELRNDLWAFIKETAEDFLRSPLSGGQRQAGRKAQAFMP